MPSPRRIAVSVDYHLVYKNHAEVFAGVHRFAEERGWITAVDEWIESTLARTKPGKYPYDGIIARVDSRRVAMVNLAGRVGVPVVNVFGGSPVIDRLPGVFPDFAAIGRLQAEHLLSRGLRHFAYVCPSGRSPAEQQLKAFAETVAPSGSSFMRIDIPESRNDSLADYQRLVAHVHAVMDRWELPVGLATGNDIFARLFTEMAHERGWQIPRDIAIISCLNESSLCEKPRPALTSVEIGYERIGYEAARLLENLMDETAASKGKRAAALRGRRAKRSEPPRHVILQPVGVVVRESTDFFGSDDEFVTKAQAYIAQHCHGHLEVRDVAAHLDVSTKTLQTRFASVLKHTVADEIRRIRLEKVKRELVSGRRPIKEIAARAGFTSSALLSAVFRRELGISPRQYRNERTVPHGR